MLVSSYKLFSSLFYFYIYNLQGEIMCFHSATLKQGLSNTHSGSGGKWSGKMQERKCTVGKRKKKKKTPPPTCILNEHAELMKYRQTAHRFSLLHVQLLCRTAIALLCTSLFGQSWLAFCAPRFGWATRLFNGFVFRDTSARHELT